MWEDYESLLADRDRLEADNATLREKLDGQQIILDHCRTGAYEWKATHDRLMAEKEKLLVLIELATPYVKSTGTCKIHRECVDRDLLYADLCASTAKKYKDSQ
jgi:hypothetical protein